ncbi:MAG TPA: hypothetical protein VGC34_07555 [Steroidobacteraceae bacterium]
MFYPRMGLPPVVFAVAMNSAWALPNVLNAGTHADTYIAPAIESMLGQHSVDSDIYVDYDPPGSITQALNDSVATSLPFNSVASGAVVNHAPYTVINGSYCCSHGAGDDATYYQRLFVDSQILSTALAVQVGGPLPAGTAPPTLNTNASAPNSNNGGTGWGIEFGLSANYFGLDTSEDSWVSAEMAGFLAALQYEHSDWHWFDIKAALRQTASNWATGYSHSAFGYGFVAWINANAISSPANLYLQPPGMSVLNLGSSLAITLYPFRQTRRSFEVVYRVSSSYKWPLKNEYTSADIAAAGGTLLYTSNGSDNIPHFMYWAAAAGTVNLVAFTSDGLGNYSRVEEFSVVPAVLTAPAN